MNKKRILAAGLVVLMVFGMLGGCKKKMTAADLLAKMAEASAKQKTISTDWDMTMDMTIKMTILGEMSVDTTVEAKGITEMDTEKNLSHTNASMTVGVLGQSQDLDLEMYTEMTDKKTMTSYVKVFNLWGKQSTEVPEMEADADAIMDLVDLKDYFALAEAPVEKDGTSYYEMTARVPAEELMPKLAQFTSVVQNGTDIDLRMFEGKTFVYRTLVDQKTFLPATVDLSLEEGDGNTGAEGTEASGDANVEAKNAGEAGEAEEKNTEAETTEDAGVPVTGIETEPTGDAETEAAPEKEEEIEDADSLISMDYKLSVYKMNMTFAYPETLEIVIPEDAKNALSLGDTPELFDTEEDGGLQSQYENLSDPEVLKEFSENDADALLWNDQKITVWAEKIYQEGDDLYVDLRIKNDNDFEVEFSSEAFAINHIMSEGSFYQSVKGGKTKTACIKVHDRKNLGITKIHSLSLSFLASDVVKYDQLFSSGVKEIVLDQGEEAAAPKPGGTKVYEDEHLAVIAYPRRDDASDRMIPLCVISKESKAVALSSDRVTSGEKEINAFAYGNILPGCICYCDLSAEKNLLAEAGAEDLADVAFVFVATDMVKYEEIFTTGTIKIP